MRWTEIEETAGREGRSLPTYRLMDKWTREGLLKAEFKGDRHGRYRDWEPAEVEVALLVARLMALGFTSELAFKVARTEKSSERLRMLSLKDGRPGWVLIEIEGE